MAGWLQTLWLCLNLTIRQAYGKVEQEEKAAIELTEMLVRMQVILTKILVVGMAEPLEKTEHADRQAALEILAAKEVLALHPRIPLMAAVVVAAAADMAAVAAAADLDITMAKAALALLA